eukprot:2272212-Pleurochrysis_carterae.AAC.1
MTGLAETSKTWASHLAADDLPHEGLALESTRHQLGVCRDCSTLIACAAANTNWFWYVTTKVFDIWHS